ncbi:MAG TPA: helicase-related protein, partial [Bacteroidales bacterium]|nr:helicase-related protein [Bacteroidales bacterium]
SPRVISREHTGVLDRSNREKIEQSFKSNLADRSVNTLVATSTLEMGIDIGQLESALNLGLPPLPSNYMQRIGRAGRSSGSSLISNFVSQKNPHDLFFFEEPIDMMDGEIHTPGCFLNAPEILKRQFLAHCIDRWVKDDPKKNQIPIFIMNLRLTTTDLRDSDFFLNRLFTYISTNKVEILENLKKVYEPDLDEKQLNTLDKDISRGSFSDWMLAPFYSLRERMLQIQKHRKEIDKYIKEKKLSEKDEERIALENDKKSLYRTSRKLSRQQIIEFMTLSGLLPNYAFPDKGTEFSGRIYQPAAKGSESEPQNITKEYVRPSSLAIRELAPHNNFFAEGYKFFIQGLLTHEWGGKNSTLEKYRFCSNCDHIELERGNNSKTCPKCGDASFGAASNVHNFAEMTGVKSEVVRDKAALDDSSDDRDLTFYEISRHASFDEKSGGSLALVDIPFGIEFAPNVEITEVNLGKIDTISATSVNINQHERVARHGFVTCRHCGYSTNTPSLEANHNNSNKYKFHYPYCQHRNKVYSGQSDDVFEEVYLYRRQKTEALKILLPVQTFATDEFRQIFKAGIELGLREFYKGNPTHLAFMDYREYNHATLKFDEYLLLYDRVPGGTGYLSKLYDRENFTEILKKAYLKIKTCSCQHDGKDGCYHCIYSYRNQYISSILSRSRAEKIFEDLLKHASNWKSLNHSLSDVTRNGKIEESELEDRFIVAIDLWCSKNNWTLKKELVNNIQTYYLTVPQNGDRAITYWIRPQVWLGTADGVKVSTRPDFIMQPVKSDSDPDTFKTYKEIAIYLDGYQFHASKENNRFLSDIEKRKAILESERYKIWTLTWDDVDGFIKQLTDDVLFRDKLSPDHTQYSKSSDLIRRTPVWKFHDSTKSFFDNSMMRLLGMLTIPEDQREKSIGVAGMRNMENFPKPNISGDKAIDYFKMQFDIEVGESVPNGEFGKSYLQSAWSRKEKLFESKVLILLSKSELHSMLWYKKDQVENIDHDEWNRFWRLWNLLQYGNFDVDEISNVTIDEEKSLNIEEIVLLFDEELHPIIKHLLENDIPFNQEGGFFIELEDGFAEAELGFEDPKIVFIPIDERSKKEFEKRGYEIADPKTFDINRILS